MLHLKTVDVKTVKIDTLIIPVCEDKEIHDNSALSSMVKQAKKLKEFKGKKGDEVTLYNMSGTKIGRAIFIGMGKVGKIDAEALRSFAGKGVKKCINNEVAEVCIAAPEASKVNLDEPILFESIMEGACLGNHVFDKYKKEKKQQPLKKINFIVKKAAVRKFNRLPAKVLAVCQGTIQAREWVSTPPNDKRPDQFARSISALSRKQGLKVKVFGEKELKQQKFGSLLAVSAGSRSKPRMVVLEHRPGNAKKTIVLVGKGVTFDSGGINLKPSGSLEDMKTDMSGAAAVAATLIAAAKLNIKKNIVGVMPIVENMPSGDASRPGDIVKSYDGKTVEIGNTDAEGRLILIDAMAWAVKKFKPHTIIDIATLTGACMIALGEKIAGVFSFEDKLVQDILDSADKTYERCWRLPLPDDYKELLKSDLADIKNISNTRYGGAITAALFISEFVEDQRWAHIDIAGPASATKANAYCNAGGTGFGVRLFCDLLEKL
ncbi:MAG: leucyl aminopeptidase [Deltaproteobacteria bacterium]|nr:leucyl aminopeptidase [Deltaproteobacteria bacterium]